MNLLLIPDSYRTSVTGLRFGRILEVTTLLIVELSLVRSKNHAQDSPSFHACSVDSNAALGRLHHASHRTGQPDENAEADQYHSSQRNAEAIRDTQTQPDTRPSITPIGFNPTRADDFGGGGTILYSMDYSSLSAMDASGKNDRIVIPVQKIDSKFISWQFLSDGKTIIYTDFADLFLTDLKGRTPEKLPGFDKAAFFSLSPDRTHLAFSTRSDSGEATLFGYDIATQQRKELAKTSQRDGFSLLGWLDEGKHFLASGAAGTENILTERLYDVTDGSSVPFEAAWLKAGHPPFEGSFSRSPKGKFAYCDTRVVGLLNITDGTKTELASMPSGEICGLDPVWSPDERYILFGSGRRSGEFNRIPLTMQAVNVETKQVTLIKKFDPTSSSPRIMSFDWFAAAP